MSQTTYGSAGLVWFLAISSVSGLIAGEQPLSTTVPSVPVSTSAEQETADAEKHPTDTITSNEKPVQRYTLQAARERAELMHEIYRATLDAMHHRYFHGERAVVPARAMEDVFEDIQKQNQSQARWIAASLKAMSINHEPETQFEKAAARAISRGEDGIEVIEDGFYRRAGSIPLTGGCIGCHGGFSIQPSATAKFAGLVISIPINQGESLEDAPADLSLGEKAEK
ncbi:MAG: DUF3365 domain-containing protein [Planctomycetaceae bacterium]|nr:DUF3365 domain-containing protein [Planctomycetaceae bacterium]